MLLYFVEGQTSVKTREEVRAVGLSHAFAQPPINSVNDRTGPGDLRGVCLARAGERIGYYPDQQTWRRFPTASGGPRVFVGYWNDKPPTPADLQVEEPLRGHPVKLRDGQLWIAPVAIQHGDQGSSRALPGRLELDDNGEWISGAMDARCQRLWDLASAYWAELRIGGTEPTGDITIRFDLNEIFDRAIEALSANYRLTRAEVALLGLFDDAGQVATEILQALIDLPTLLAWAKQKKSMSTDASPPAEGT